MVPCHSQEELRAAVRKVDPNKSLEEVDALIRLGLMIEKHKDVVTEELDEEGKALAESCTRGTKSRLRAPPALRVYPWACAGNVVGTKTERVVVERKLIHRLQELPHAAVEFQTNEFMSLVRMNPIVRQSPAPEKQATALEDTQTSGVWNAQNEGNDGDMYEGEDVDMNSPRSPGEDEEGSSSEEGSD